jgi:hypothetical protein
MENIACKRCIDAINTRYKEEIRLCVQWEFAVASGVCCGDSCVKKNQSAGAELNRRGSVQRMGMAHRALRTDIANDLSRKAIRQTEQRSGAEQ